MTPAKLAQVRPKAAVNRAAWLDQMAADAGHQHVARLVELRIELQVLATRRDFAPLLADLQRAAEALSLLDFGLLQSPGFFARLTGKGRNAGAEFHARFDRIEEAFRVLSQNVGTLQGQQGARASRTDRSLLEFEVEYRALDKLLDQGARWLQDMRNQLKARQASAVDEAARRKIAEDTGRCEILVARLKALRAASSGAQRSHQQAQATAARRVGIVQLLAQALAADLIEWRGRLAPVAAAAREGRIVGPALDAAMESHRELQLCLKQAVADCSQVQVQQQALEQRLDELGLHLQAAATAG